MRAQLHSMGRTGAITQVEVGLKDTKKFMIEKGTTENEMAGWHH